ncbi:hypothetical protein [Histidinibacterium aquaticum]|uniref:Uncharacterized protein n=1 Tax=Histidinibacterium aquaticum TaxID=2613962 RepID=A0A5J5GMN7_9RHOB|nr:hypothetical protein [Histidinibacterium aquaticum]KAA9008953.1 hypothetical protein F3S47_06735 [Histidinibacterium aquaticum]
MKGKTMLNTTSRRIALSAGVAVLALQAHAQEPDYCGAESEAWWAEEAATLDGVWSVQNGAGVLTMNGRTVPLPTGDASTASISVTAGGLTIDGGPAPGSYPLELYRGPDLNFTPEEGSAAAAANVLDGDEMSTVLGCDLNALPRLHATGTFTEPQGQVEFDLYLIVQGPGFMTGATIGRLNGGQGIARRAITFTR